MKMEHSYLLSSEKARSDAKEKGFYRVIPTSFLYLLRIFTYFPPFFRIPFPLVSFVRLMRYAIEQCKITPDKS
jgi:hypothetical protein